MKNLSLITLFLISSLITVTALSDDTLSALSIENYEKSNISFNSIYTGTKEGVLYKNTKNTNNNLSIFISKNSNYYLMTDFDKLGKETGLWYQQRGNNIDDPDTIRSGIFRNNQFIGHIKCKSGCSDNYFSRSKSDRKGNSRNIIWSNDKGIMYLSNSDYEEVIYYIEFDKKKYKVMVRRFLKPEYDGIVDVYAMQDKKRVGIILVLNQKKRVIEKTYNFYTNLDTSKKYPSQMMKSEDAIEPTYPIVRNNKINDVSAEAYDIAVALIDYIDGNFKTIKDMVFNDKEFETNQSSFKKLYNMIVAYEKDIEDKKLLAIKNKQDEISALFERKKEILKDVYFGDRVLIRNAADSPYKGLASQKNIKHFDSCENIKDGLINYMQIKTDSNGVKTLYQGKLLLKESSVSELTDILFVKTKKEASNYSLPEQSVEDKISTEYIKESASHEKIYYINPTHLAYGNSTWTVDAKRSERKIDHNSKIFKSDALILLQVDKALEDDKHKKSASKRQADIDLSKKEIGGLMFGSCPADDFEKLQARLSKKNIDQTLLAKELSNSKKRWNRAVENEKQRQLQQAKNADQCIRYQRFLWDTWGSSKDIYFQFIAGGVYRNEWLPFIRSNCNITVPHTGGNG